MQEKREVDFLPMQTEQRPTRDEAKFLLELSLLSKAQYESLQKASYLLMPRGEREAYDRRRVRIEEVRGLLSKLDRNNSSGGSKSTGPDEQGSVRTA